MWTRQAVAASHPTPTARGRAGRVRIPAIRGSALRFVALELVIWAGLYGAYLAIRGVAIASEPTAMGNAHALVDLERTLGIFHEAAVQDAMAPALGFLSVYYMLGFGPLVAGVLVWLAATRRADYRHLRTALLVSIALASVIFVLLPTAPPRLVEDLAIADTVGLSAGHDQGSFMGIAFNPYAAMPSMHVGWSLLVGVAGYRAARSPLARAFFAAHPAVMTLTVVATGNHYLLDAVAGVAVVGTALLVIRTCGIARRALTTP